MSPTVRTALATDAAAIAAVRIASWRATYGDHLPAHVWDDYDAESVAARFAASIGDERSLAPANWATAWWRSGCSRRTREPAASTRSPGFITDGAIKPVDLPGGARLPEVRYRRG